MIALFDDNHFFTKILGNTVFSTTCSHSIPKYLATVLKCMVFGFNGPLFPVYTQESLKSDSNGCPWKNLKHSFQWVSMEYSWVSMEHYSRFALLKSFFRWVSMEQCPKGAEPFHVPVVHSVHLYPTRPSLVLALNLLQPFLATALSQQSDY